MGILGVLNNDFNTDTVDTDSIADEKETKPWKKGKIAFRKEDVSATVEIVIADKVYISTKSMKQRM